MKKQVAPVFDIFPQIAIEQDFSPEVIAREVELTAGMVDCDRMYCVVTNEGYPMFSDSWTALMPEDNTCGNHALANIRRVGDGNRLFVEAIHAQGKKAFAVFKPYELGGGRCVAHGAPIAPYTRGVEDLGGTSTGYGTFMSAHPECAVQRFPYDCANENAPIEKIIIDYMLDAYTNKTGGFSWEEVPAFEGEIPAMAFELYSSEDNGVYVPVDGIPTVAQSVRSVELQDAAGISMNRTARVLHVELTGFSLKSRYTAVVQTAGPKLPMIPQVMVNAECANGAVPVTVTAYVRQSSCPKGQPHVWGNDKRCTVSATMEIADDFKRAGFEFDWHGAGFFGDGWVRTPVVCIGRGKRRFMRGTPCEGEPAVREYWLSYIEKLMDMGFDGIDVRMQNHSGMVSDWTQYGWNEPIRERYRELKGKELDPADYDPMDVLRARGSFYVEFLKEARDRIHARGKILQVHVRNAQETEAPLHEHNQLGFWAMPKILPDWREIVDLADEITLKDYHFGRYNPEFSLGVKARCREQGKPVWMHMYLAQGGELNEEFLRKVQADDGVSGILLYEVTHDVVGENGAGETKGLVSVRGGVATDDTATAKVLKRMRGMLAGE